MDLHRNCLAPPELQKEKSQRAHYCHQAVGDGTYNSKTVPSSLYLLRWNHVFVQVDSRDWAMNGNTISLDEDTVIDVPQPFDQLENYCASLGHKANHSFSPNCRYEP